MCNYELPRLINYITKGKSPVSNNTTNEHVIYSQSELMYNVFSNIYTKFLSHGVVPESFT